ncbi:chitobiase/beta-hexosaminidase C-terminal domain-containing protein [Ravibacter arvi]|uniref:Chitobiase/beta-hexosaminidase C-terminal domain-containing protein n=1 Tax=Ravibacter arvi TaxID=2051041 RepID=A0ABP8LN35_9BACT
MLYNTAFFLNGLLVFFLVFEDRLVTPGWMYLVGRFHPLVLHFPLVVLLLFAGWVIVVEKPGSNRWHAGLADTLLLTGTLTAAVAALSGFVLSQEDGYEADAIFFHKWLGIGVSLGSLAWYAIPVRRTPWNFSAKAVAVVFILVTMAAGHLGGNLTHGNDFLIPAAGEKARVALEDAQVYRDLVQPVLQQKCYPCHNADKAKGGLQMHTRELLAKGGENGIPWDTTQADLGLLLRRVHLPANDKKHMPPRGKAQLTEDEVVLLTAWIKSGSGFDGKVSELPRESPLYSYAQAVLRTGSAEDMYAFKAADASRVAALNTNYRIVKPLAPESPALVVNFYNRAAFKNSDISDLLPVGDQVISMDLSKMPVGDEDLKTIARFSRLRKLLLNFTDIKGNTLSELKKLPFLKELALSGTAVTATHLKTLEEIPSLRDVYLWSTPLSADEFAHLKKSKKIRYESGFRSDTVVIALNAPTVENQEQILTGGTRIRLSHRIPGAEIRYNLDGTVPDSAVSAVYSGPIAISQNTKLVARAFRAGWLGSAPVERFFIKANYRADSVHLISPPDAKFKGKGGKTLSDGIRSITLPNSGDWLGYRDTDFQSDLFFRKPVKVSSVTLSMLQNLNRFIFPPARLEVWGGANPDSLALLKVIRPAMPKKMVPGNEDFLLEAGFEPRLLGCIRVIAKPVGKLPAWHPKKGEKGWVFVDEVIIN